MHEIGAELNFTHLEIEEALSKLPDAGTGLPKEESFLLVDVETKKVLKQPSVGKIEVSKNTKNYIEVRMSVGKEGFNFFLFLSLENEKGESIETTGQSAWRDTEYDYYAINFTQCQFVKSLKIDFYAYPNYSNGDIDIELHEWCVQIMWKCYPVQSVRFRVIAVNHQSSSYQV